VIKKEKKFNEARLIEEIKQLSLATGKFNKSLIINSIGDDCAIFKDKNHILVSSDNITENVHFKLDSYSFLEIGEKSLLVNISDIAAMGGIPRLFTLSLSIPEYVSENEIRQTISGIIKTARKYKVSLVGGNISKSSEFSISVTIIGDYKHDNVVRRFGSKIGDKIFVSGELGNSWMAYYLQSNKKYIYENNPNIRSSDKKLIENFIAKFKLPKPRVKLGRELSAKKLANSLTDISDGLSKDIFNVLDLNHGGKIELDEVPFNKHLKYIANILKIDDFIDNAISFGEDYELLWTAGADKEGEILELSKNTGTKIKKIGYIADKFTGARFFKDGRRYHPKNFTFKHL